MIKKYFAKSSLLVLIFISQYVISQSKAKENKKMNVAVFVYEGVEILDFGGPSEVFASSGKKNTQREWKRAFNVYTVAASEQEIKSQGFIKVTPNYTIKNCPTPDIIILPGGATSDSRKNIDVIKWIQRNAKNSIMLSVCTGAFLLADAGLLENKKATTWYGVIEKFQREFPKTKTLKNVRFVDNGSIITTAGVSAGIDGSLHLVRRLLGIEAAKETAKYMEYDKWDEKAGLIVKTNEQ